MLDYQRRVITEKDDLDRKAEALNAFLLAHGPGEMDVAERGRLLVQEAVMDAYSAILAARIEAF